MGTSTGGIIALALACNVPLARVVELYAAKGEIIFNRRKTNPGALQDSKYDNTKLLQALRDVYGRDGETGEYRKLKHAAAPVCIPSINVLTGEVKVFRTSRAPADRADDGECFVWEVAACTSAAPTYFPAFRLTGGAASYADGGLWANDPALVGIEEALSRGVSLEEIRILSVGTGNSIFKTDSQEEFRGLLSWFRGLLSGKPTLVDLAFTTQAQGVSRVMERLLKPDRRVRVDEPLPSNSPLDDLSIVDWLRARATKNAERLADDVLPKFFSQERLSSR